MSPATYLCDPNWTTPAQLADLVDPVLQVKLQGMIVVPMDRDEVNMTALALVEKLAQPVVAGIRDCRCAKLYLACIRLHIRLPCCYRRFGGHVCLVWTVGLVETQQMLGSSLHPVASVVMPLLGVIALGAPEHGYKLGKGLFLVCRAIPVVLPVNLGLVAFKSSPKVIDGNAVIGSEAAFRRFGGGGCRQQQRCCYKRAEVGHFEHFGTKPVLL